MPITDFNEYVDRLEENRAADFWTNIGRAIRPTAGWQNFAIPAATPTTSVALDRTSLQALNSIPVVSTGRLTLLGARLSGQTYGAGGIIVLDLLNVNGGLNATLTTTQTTNLPTAALTRYTSGEGVMAAIVVYVILGTTATTFTISYTNQAGTSGRTSTAQTIGSAGFREIGMFLPIPLQEGDTGIRSVDSVTLAGTTGQAGNFGVCLYKPLAMISMESATGSMPLDAVSTGGIINSLCEIHANACLTISPFHAAISTVSGALILGEV